LSTNLVKELLDSGIHFGHRCARWNPKMQPYIYGKRNHIHIIDIRETLRGLLRAKKFIARLVGNNGEVLFVGTKRQAREIVERQTARCGMHYVSERWLGGTLTNFRTIRSRLQRLEELEALVASPAWETGYSKKMKAMLTRELEKIRRNLEGIRKMSRLPGVIVAIDVNKEMNALREARALNVPTICLIDTDSNPDMVDIPIPGNDDAMRGIEIIMRELADAVEEGMKGRPEPVEQAETRDRDRGERGDRGDRDRGDRDSGPRRPRRRVPDGREAPAPAPAAEAPPAEPVAGGEGVPA
jgi:small subunit ribosomal protein S2